MLLTSGQISMGISSCVVFVFTSLLFLSGYILQQQTVRSLHVAIHPPPEPSPTATTILVGKAFGRTSNVPLQPINAADGPSHVNWDRMAHVQLVPHFQNVCNALIIFAELARQGSPAQKLLIYPRAWDNDMDSGARSRHHITSVRLLEKAKKQFGVSLLPVDPMISSKNVTEIPDILEGLLSLTDFDRLLYLEQSGLVHNSHVLDSLFTEPMNSSILVFQENTGGKRSGEALIFRPSITPYKLSASTGTVTVSTKELILPPTELAITPRVITGTSTIRLAALASYASFDIDTFLSNVGFVKFSDPEILGPDFDIPKRMLLRLNPPNIKQRKPWEDLYEIYRTQRMEICGLDLEPLPQSEIV